jgi:hypothetical protein
LLLDGREIQIVHHFLLFPTSAVMLRAIAR